MATDDLFVNFVNKELPKRVSSNENPLTVTRGFIPVSSGVGLGVEFKDPNDLQVGGVVPLQLVTYKDIPYGSNGSFPLPTRPYGDLVFNRAMLRRTDGSFIEVDNITIGLVADVLTVTIDPNDHLEIGADIVSATVSYMEAVPVQFAVT